MSKRSTPQRSSGEKVGKPPRRVRPARRTRTGGRFGEQARRYAKSQNCRFVILSNGNLHYFWDLERGNPFVITAFPTPTSVIGYQKTTPDTKRLIDEVVGDDYIVLTQRPGYAEPAD